MKNESSPVRNQQKSHILMNYKTRSIIQASKNILTKIFYRMRDKYKLNVYLELFKDNLPKNATHKPIGIGRTCLQLK